MALSNGIDIVSSHEVRIVKLEENQSNLSSVMAATNEHITNMDKKMDTFTSTISSKIDEISTSLVRQDERDKMTKWVRGALFAMFLALSSGLGEVIVHKMLK